MDGGGNSLIPKRYYYYYYYFLFVSSVLDAEIPQLEIHSLALTP